METWGVAVIAGVASFLGAAIGAGGTLGSARITSRRQAKTQHIEWSRQARKDAYSAFSVAAGEVHVILMALTEAASSGFPSAEEQGKLQATLGEAKQSYRKLLILVDEIDSQGPAGVVAAAQNVVRATQFWIASVEEALKAGGRVSYPLKIHGAVRAELKQFRVAVRDVYDDPDAALSGYRA